ncbi:Ribosomal protein S18 acetylase RimI [Fontibacillus panacisegetis]|uniref:Ribosomal protein S18 acetylase RimI n=1 Tax=Fontibacillus panacisegetis TaxID=670482 RepID=A0A1G7JBX6_9BACL|nr:GNAT family N-acetyltransferase [Fontibacillus panacisegetis]SDF22405.1 Ribosomal protein S18 acetylase RimI [Fontibacillus panacisegetis]
MSNHEHIIIQNAQEEDYEQLRRIFFQSQRDDFHWVDSRSLQMSDFDHSVEGELIITASIKGQIAGFMSIWEEDHFIHNLFVASEFRRYGVGKALLDEAIKLLGKPLSLKCVKKNTNAVHFYLSQGWSIQKEETDTQEPYYFMVCS